MVETLWVVAITKQEGSQDLYDLLKTAAKEYSLHYMNVIRTPEEVAFAFSLEQARARMLQSSESIQYEHYVIHANSKKCGAKIVKWFEYLARREGVGAFQCVYWQDCENVHVVFNVVCDPIDDLSGVAYRIIVATKPFYKLYRRFNGYVKLFDKKCFYAMFGLNGYMIY